MKKPTRVYVRLTSNGKPITRWHRAPYVDELLGFIVEFVFNAPFDALAPEVRRDGKIVKAPYNKPILPFCVGTGHHYRFIYRREMTAMWTTVERAFATTHTYKVKRLIEVGP